MIGDDLQADILGAQNIGIKGVYFNPNRLASHEDVYLEISSLHHLKKIL